jgi:hypothetical protein
MKNTMKITGVAGTIMFGFAALFKIQHWPGAGYLMTLGALILALAFLPSTLVVLWKETHNTRRIFLFSVAFITGISFIAGTLFKIQHWQGAGYILLLGALVGIVLFLPALLVNRMNDPENTVKKPVYILGSAGTALFAAGLLFKMQHWPFATVFMITGIILLCVVVLPWYTWLSWKDENHVSPMFIFVVFGALLIIIPGAMINLNLQHSYQEYYYINNVRQNEMSGYLLRNNNALISRYRDSLIYKQMEQLHSRTTGMITIITNIQGKMVQESEGEPGNPAVSADQIKQTSTGNEIIYRKLSKPLDPQPARDFLLSGCSTRKELNSSMAEYITFLSGMIPAEELTKYKSMLDTEAFLPDSDNDESKISLMSGLHSLEILKNGLLAVESSVLRGISRHN